MKAWINTLFDAVLDKIADGVERIEYQARMLKHRPRLWWQRAWIRKDEFHSSLDMDARVLADMNQKDRDAYIADLVRRRNLAHQRDLD